jgi:hypothetical protein
MYGTKGSCSQVNFFFVMLYAMSSYLSQSYTRTTVIVQLFVTVKYDCVLLLFPHHLSFHSHLLFISLLLYPVHATRFHAQMWPASTPAMEVNPYPANVENRVSS